MPWFGQEIFELAATKGPLTDADYQCAVARSNGQVSRILDRVMQENGLDAIVAPTSGPAWSIDWVNGDRFSVSSSSPAAISGYPAITLPMGSIHSLPIGITFFGFAYSEDKLIAYAYSLEQALPPIDPPEFSKSLDRVD